MCNHVVSLLDPLDTNNYMNCAIYLKVFTLSSNRRPTRKISVEYVNIFTQRRKDLCNKIVSVFDQLHQVVLKLFFGYSHNISFLDPEGGNQSEER